MSKHTKTEWKLPPNADFRHEIYAKDESNPFNPNQTKIVARVEKYTHVDPKSETHKALTAEWQANAALIVAAPKLLAALERLTANITLSSEPDAEETEFTKAVADAKALLETLKD
jgi:hypothetical protein